MSKTRELKAFAFGETKMGLIVPTTGTEQVLRYSTAVKRLRATGAKEEDIAEFERDKTTASRCPTHGMIADPIVGIVRDRVAFACPHCSGPSVLKAWEDEGVREKTKP